MTTFKTVREEFNNILLSGAKPSVIARILNNEGYSLVAFGWGRYANGLFYDRNGRDAYPVEAISWHEIVCDRYGWETRQDFEYTCPFDAGTVRGLIRCVNTGRSDIRLRC